VAFSVVKGALVFGAVLGAVAVVLNHLGPPDLIFDSAGRALAEGPPGYGSLLLDPGMYTAFATLALGSALALPMYPHVLTAAFAARSPDTLRRTSIALPAWTAVLGLFGLLGVAALAFGIRTSPGNAEAAVPLLVQELIQPVLSGAIFGALAVGALVPAAVMSVAVASLFVRNVYVEYFFPTATPKHEMRVARLVSLIAKIGALTFVFGLRDQDAINLQLLGGVWILQTFPAVAIGLLTSWFHRGGLAAGWAVGMVTGTLLVVSEGFTSVVQVGVGDWSLQVYAALVALAVNLLVAAALTPLLDRYGAARGTDATVAVPPAPPPAAGVGCRTVRLR
jgi:SSS family solute:Na+ symporter